MEFLHPAMWHVALEPWQWIHQVAAPCIVIRGSGMACHWIRANVRHIGILHLVSISTHHRSRHHRLRGSASTVLTATGQVNGRWRILTPHRIETHEPIATKFRTIDYVRERTPYQIWYKSIHWGLLGIWVKYNVFVPFLFIPFFLRLAYRSDRLMDFYARWLIRREITQGSAFSGL